MDQTEPEVVQRYRERVERFDKLVEARGQRSRFVSNLRGLSFGIAVIALLFAIFGSEPRLSGALFALAAGAFIALVVWHARVIRELDEALRWRRVNRDALLRCTGRWSELPDDGKRFVSSEHPYSADLDLFGPDSLFQRVNVAHTRFGQRALSEFLSTPADPAVVEDRQQAARALVPELERRQRLEALSLSVVEQDDEAGWVRKRRAPPEPPDPEPLLRWAEGSPRLSTRPALVWAARILPPLTVLAMVAASTLGLPVYVWALPIAIQILLSFSARGETARVFSAVSATEGAFLRYGPMLEMLETLDLQAPLIARLRQDVQTEGLPPSRAMRQFERAVGWFELKHNGLVHPFVDAVLLWDIHCTLRLERWQREAGRHARGWFEALGQLEALSSLAALAYDCTDVCWPRMDSSVVCFEAENLAHPLIEADQRVANDVRLREAGHALLITGSNMSGKSTLLRSMGLAAVLAQAGGPVLATRLVMSPLAVRTSMRVSDSLREGVSHFYAELKKLKGVLGATEASDRPVFFLLDEILHGTNSEERQIGARWLLAELLERGAIGAVSTHDMELCRLPDPLMGRVDQFHFRETVSGDQMTFDYRLRPGPVAGGNALRLMRRLGIDVPLDGTPSSSS